MVLLLLFLSNMDMRAKKFGDRDLDRHIRDADCIQPLRLRGWMQSAPPLSSTQYPIGIMFIKPKSYDNITHSKLSLCCSNMELLVLATLNHSSPIRPLATFGKLIWHISVSRLPQMTRVLLMLRAQLEGQCSQ